MPITTLDGAAAGARQIAPFMKGIAANFVSGRPFSWWPTAGIPGAGTFSGSLAGATLTSSDAGCLTRSNPASGNSYVHSIRGTAQAAAGTLLLVDRLWHNGGITITSTSAQTVNSVTWPSRCPTSATDDTPSTGGFGILIGLEVSATTGTGSPTLTLSYTNSAGTSGRTTTNAVPTSSSSGVGLFYPFGLQAGDTGVRSIQSYTQSATWTSGTVNLVAYRIIASYSFPSTGTPGIDPLSSGMGRIYDDSHLSYIWIATSSTGIAPSFFLIETQG